MTLSRLFRLAAMLLVPALLSNSLAFAAKKPAGPEVMKTKIMVRGVGQGVRVTLTDQTEAKGLIVAIGDESFTLKPRKSAVVQQIEYARITGVHKDRLTRGQKIEIAVAVVGGAIVVVGVSFVIAFDNAKF